MIPIVVGAGIGGLIGAVFLWRLYRYPRRERIGMIQHFEPQGIDVETLLLGEVSRQQQENPSWPHPGEPGQGTACGADGGTYQA